jgi:two-component system sensor histidine kinase BarA
MAPPARDQAAAIRAAGGDAALAGELFQALMAQLPAELALLRRLLAAGDWKGLVDLAHRLRGATGYCGVPALEAALCDLSRAAKRSASGPAGEAAVRVEREARRLRDGSDPRGDQPQGPAGGAP